MEVPKWASGYLRAERVEMIQQAVAEAEKKTSAEIVPMIVRRSSTVGHVPALVLSLLLLVALAVDLPGWQDFHLGGGWLWYGVDLVGGILLAALLSRSAWVQRNLTTPEDREAQVGARASLEFYQSEIKATEGATGVLIFVSLMERRAVVLADRAINEKVPADSWAEVCALLVKGIRHANMGVAFGDAIGRCGEILAPLLPIQPDDVNELSDRLVIKD